FSIDLSGAAYELTGAVLTTLDHIVHRARNPFYPPNWVPTPRNLRFQAALKRLDREVYRLMQDRQQMDDPGDDMLGMLLRARDEDGQPMAPAQVRDEIITLLIAGHETVASALTWTWYLLAQQPDVRQKLEAEIQSVLGGRVPVSADLASLPYTAAVFEEALRLYPPAWLITRTAIEADQICGFDIPAGSLIILSPYVIHRQEAYWPDPEMFRPERFLADAGKDRPRYAYIPFGGGPRLCIGSGFAAVEAQLMIAMTAQRFQLELLPNHPVQVDALVTLRPHGGLPMRLVRVN
ncbi:cytochrome P450, partial [bacterium]|nr:cytochrome P450 [bacterium]